MKLFQIFKLWAVCLTLALAFGCASDVKVSEDESTNNEEQEVAERSDAGPLAEESDAAVPTESELANTESAPEEQVAASENTAPKELEAAESNATESHAAVSHKKDAKFIDTLLAEKSDKNRYYILRAGDTPQKVAVLIYKDPREAGKLVHWNGEESEWHVGRVVYYVSPNHPGDKHMISFYEENKIAPKKVTIQPGETLESLAEMHLGSRASSRELALLNGLPDQTEVEAGRVLDVFPVLKSEKLEESEAKKALAQSFQNAKPAPAPVSDVQAMMAAKAQVPQAVASVKPTPKPAKASLASTVVASVQGHQGIIFGCTLVVAALFAAYFFLQRKKSSDFDL